MVLNSCTVNIEDFAPRLKNATKEEIQAFSRQVLADAQQLLAEKKRRLRLNLGSSFSHIGKNMSLDLLRTLCLSLLQQDLVQTLSLRNCHLDAGFIKDFTHFLPFCKHLEDLDISKNKKLDCSALEPLFKKLEDGKLVEELRKVDLSETRLDTQGLQNFTKIISARCQTLKTIDLQDCIFSGEDVQTYLIPYLKLLKFDEHFTTATGKTRKKVSLRRLWVSDEDQQTNINYVLISLRKEEEKNVKASSSFSSLSTAKSKEEKAEKFNKGKLFDLVDWERKSYALKYKYVYNDSSDEEDELDTVPQKRFTKKVHRDITEFHILVTYKYENSSEDGSSNVSESEYIDFVQDLYTTTVHGQEVAEEDGKMADRIVIDLAGLKRIGGRRIQAEHIALLSYAIAAREKKLDVFSLNLARSEICGEALQPFFKNLTSSTSNLGLRDINITGNHGVSDHIHDLCTFLSQNKSVKNFYLADCGLKNADLPALTSAVMENTSLEFFKVQEKQETYLSRHGIAFLNENLRGCR